MCCAPSVWETQLLGSVLALAIQRVIYIPRQNNLSGNRIQEEDKIGQKSKAECHLSRSPPNLEPPTIASRPRISFDDSLAATAHSR